MGRKHIVLEIEDYELHEWHECWMGGKHIVLEIEDFELLEWSECELRGYLCGGISVITPLPAGEGTGEGPAGDGGGASSRWLVEGLPFSVLYSFYTPSWQYLASFSLYIHNGKGCSKIGWT